ncbi:hypothetical protein [Halomicrobium urmianum]|uniref:hypothetical protein n=1 Tax=Halomicrobium urmianum TaxID=1586233 RepID=UPI001CD9720D|nr:hypothetical protein [Halomicrobium urmianum]
MTGALESTESYDGSITVVSLDDSGERDRTTCSSYEDAIALMKTKQSSTTVVKIEDRNGEIVFSSAKTDIRQLERTWKREKRTLSVDVEERACPYDNVACFADDLCVQCEMDEVQRRH